MQMPSQDLDRLFEELVQDLPPETELMAREFRALTRARKVKTVGQLMRLVLLYCGLDKSLRQTAGVFTMLYERITDQSIMERLIASQSWIKALLPKMLDWKEVPKLEGRRVCIVDATDISGAGGKNYYRLHVSMDLLSLTFLELTITNKYSGESLKNYTFAKTDIVLSDRGYCHADAIVEKALQGIDLIGRVHVSNLPLFDLDENRIDLAEKLADQARESTRSIAVTIKSKSGKEKVRGFLHIYRLGEKQAQRARRKCLNKRIKNCTKNPNESALFFSEFVIVFTNISTQDLSAETILQLYRCRWQIELAFKRWKSLLKVDLIRAKIGSPLADLWIHGKLLYALMVQRRSERIIAPNQYDLDQADRITFWSVWQAIIDQIHPVITGVAFWRLDAWPQFLKVSSQRPRRRKLQTIPEIVLLFIDRDVSQFKVAA